MCARMVARSVIQLWCESCNWNRSMPSTPAQQQLQTGAAAIFVDLENVFQVNEDGSTGLQLLRMICSQQGIELRAYAKVDHPTACRATHTVQSNERESINMQMVWDMAMYCSDKHQVAHVLLVTDSRYGKALASLDLAANKVSWAPLELSLPQPWRRALGATSTKDLFINQPHERPRARSRSRSRSREDDLSDDNLSTNTGVEPPQCRICFNNPVGAWGLGQGQGRGKGRRRWIFCENGCVHPTALADTPSPTRAARIFDRCSEAAAIFAASTRASASASPR